MGDIEPASRRVGAEVVTVVEIGDDAIGNTGARYVGNRARPRRQSGQVVSAGILQIQYLGDLFCGCPQAGRHIGGIDGSVCGPIGKEVAALREADFTPAVPDLCQLSDEIGAITGPLQRFDIVGVREAVHAREFNDQLLGDRSGSDQGVGTVGHVQKECRHRGTQLPRVLVSDTVSLGQ
ncbi:Uncharacterised protein [Mycobacteroides abscessus subsp. massiliense]|nr:Uncharacterised protein [Mycobacteroides abscessus subsp. massiliense]